ncbi:MAG: YdeI/OmpD-associated family protein [Acidobacteria bacterium]|nr:YdeI/OmpD-associated family protein [Acidobacteriota bacterium]
MSAKNLSTLDVRSRGQWRKWLREHHDSQSEIWLVFYKRHTSEKSIIYDAAVEEALCFGWIDSIIRRLDDDRYVRKFTPRKPDSKWSTINRRRYADLKTRGLLAAPGLDRPPTGRSGDAPRPLLSALPPYIEKGFKTDARAWEYFEQLAPSYRRAYIARVDSAKREETKQRRLSEAIRLAAAGKKLGMK